MMPDGVTDDVVALRKAHPTATAAWIAQQVGRTRERVRQILAKAQLPTRAQRPAPLACRSCGVIVPSDTVKRRLSRGYKVDPTLCHVCFYKSRRLSYTCEACGKVFQQPWGRRRLPNRFCSHRCNGSVLGKLYGFGAPGNNGIQKGQEARRRRET